MPHKVSRFEITPSTWITLIVASLATIPGLYLGIVHETIAPENSILYAVIFGAAIFGASFILTWAAEAAQIDISESLAVAILALIAVLPEYAVDFVFTWRSASDPAMQHLAIANMTGANRLLVGLGWPVVLLLYYFATKRKAIIIDESQRVEIFYLAMATIYSFTIPLKGSLNLIDTAILITLFVLYTRRASQMESVEPELVGPPKILANMKTGNRRAATGLMFLYAGGVIFFVAEPFADSLIGVGTNFGISKFFLVQWLAPIASESPEFIVAATWALRGHAGSALRALISSKVNQWTLLIGTIPLVYAIAGGAVRPFVLDTLQNHELYLTAAQSLFAVAVLVNLRFSKVEGIFLFLLFALQLVVSQIRMEVAVVYVVLALIVHIKHRKCLVPAAVVGLGLRTKSRK